MKKDVFVVADNIISPLGFTSEDNFANLKNEISGIKLYNDTVISPQPFHASLLSNEQKNFDIPSDEAYTLFEKLLIRSIQDAADKCTIDVSSSRTIFIISTTKGNISLLEDENDQWPHTEKISLHHSAKAVTRFFKNTNQPLIVSNACISGLLAVITGMRLIRSGQYDNAIVAGADVISKFILSGFQSFQAISAERCRPFDAERKGINLGDGAATVILSCNKNKTTDIKVVAGSTSNDANHISGPSRTGEELHMAITKVMQEAEVAADAIDFISAHGTATIYNDEMEAKALTLSNLQSVPVNSLKPYYGHTLGAAGLIESIASIHSLKENVILPTLGFKQIGVPTPVNVCSSLYKTTLQNCLKIASGFGGCNAAIIFSKQ